jgi:endonuclease/exonuclease/phosphatase (EEP) superfamily protein YafD
MGRRLVKRSLIVAREGAPEQVAVTPFEYSNGVILRFPLKTGGEDVQIVATHPPSPGLPNQMFDRNRQLLGLADGLATGRPFIVMGDFNTTPWGRIFGAVPGVRAGDPRFDGSFPADMGPLGLPIDHIMFGGGLTLTDYRVGPDIASDHRPLFATFALPMRASAVIGTHQLSSR